MSIREVLITGATGALGPDLLKRVRATHPGASLTLIGRNPPREPLPPGDRFLTVDLADTSLMKPELIEQLGEITHVIHLAAEIRWNQTIDVSAAVNVAGTRRLIELVRASCPKVERFVFVSTAYVAPPARTPTVPPVAVVGDTKFANSYEYSKWLGEQEVKKSGLPWTIVRPSLVVGSSVDGSIGRFNGLYMLIEHGVMGRVPFVLGSAESLIDVVSVDRVSEAIVDSLTDPELVEAIVLVCRATAGDRAKKFMSVMDPKISAFRQAAGVPPVQWPAFVSYDKFNRLFRPMMEPVMRPTQLAQLEILKLFLPYFTAEGVIDVSLAKRTYYGFDLEPLAEKCAEYWLKMRRKRALTPQYQWRAQNVGTGS
jgi:nucleoside-diphosphate-sugar epimerase